jgi:predicted NAD-dependent protein-ADP-ribosyltransferase YbiA (DUF1768 family)
MEVKFIKKTDEYWCFSNFAKCGFLLDNEYYEYVEVYFQSQKFIDYPDYKKLIQSCDSPMKAKLLGTQNTNYRFGANWKINKNTNHTLVFDAIKKYNNVFIRKDWEEIKNRVMLKALRAKFSQSSILKKKLLETGNAKIIEDNHKDYYWGIGNGSGKNMLGKLLMQVRTELVNEA